MKKALITAFAILASSAAQAEDNINVYLGGFSAHFDERSGGRDYNEVHNNIGLEYESRWNDSYRTSGTYWGIAGQYMKNSLNNDSALITANLKHKWALDEDWKVSVGLMAGAQNGYPKKGKRDKDEFIPVAYPTLEINYQRFGVYGTCVPEIYASGFCFAGFKFNAYTF